jgi:exonuclease VII small subunit
MPEPSLTPAQQALMGFLERLATTDKVSHEMLEEGNNLLDRAVEDHRQGADQLHKARKALFQANRELKGHE